MIHYLVVDIGEEGNKKRIYPSHKRDEIERAIPIGKLALYYAAAQYIDLRDAMEKYCPSKSFPVLALVMNQVKSDRRACHAADNGGKVPKARFQTKKLSVL